MQKPTSVQLDEKVEELMNKKMDSTIPNEVRNILAGHIKPSIVFLTLELDGATPNTLVSLMLIVWMLPH